MTAFVPHLVYNLFILPLQYVYVLVVFFVVDIFVGKTKLSLLVAYSHLFAGITFNLKYKKFG